MYGLFMFGFDFFSRLMDILQLNKVDFRYLVMIMVITSTYFLSRPLISFFVSLDSIRLLTYLVSSLFVLLALCLVFIVMDIDHLLLIMIKITLHCLAFFGIGLSIVQAFIHLTKKHNKKA